MMSWFWFRRQGWYYWVQGYVGFLVGVGQRFRVFFILLIFLQLQLEKYKGEILGVVVVESGWGFILFTVILANMMNGGSVVRLGKLSIGDQIMFINGISLVGLFFVICQGIIKVSVLGFLFGGYQFCFIFFSYVVIFI